MKQIALVLLALSVVSCLNDIQGQGSLTQVKELLAQSHLGRVFLKLTQLKDKAQQFDFSKLYGALDELEGSLRANMDAENDSYGQAQVKYQTDVAFFNDQITQFTNEVATHDIDIQDLSESRVSLEQSLEGKRQELDESRKLKKKLEDTMAKDATSNTQQQAEYNEAITALDQAIALVGQARDGSFVEMSQIDHVRGRLEQNLKSFSHRRVFIKPIMQALTQVAQGNFADSEALSKILRLLQQLRDNLSNSKLSLANTYQAQLEQNQRILDEFNDKVNTLEQDVIPRIQSDIETKVGEVNTKQQLKSDSQANLKAAKDNLEATENSFVKRTNQNRQLLNQYNNELAVVGEAVTHLQRAGIRRN